MKRTRLIRVPNEFVEWIDSRGSKFFDPFNVEHKKVTRTKSIEGLMKLVKNSRFYFPDNLNIENHNKKVTAELRGKFRL